MKKIYIMLIAMLALTGLGCKKFLNIVPVDNLSGNNYWQTKKDVEGFTNGLYKSLKDKLSTGFITMGDMRSAPINTNEGNYGALFAANNIPAISNFRLNNSSTGNTQWTTGWTWGNMAKWKPFYDIISSANLLYQQVDKVPSGVLSSTDIKRYKAEAVFVRNLCYFFLVRLYGDVPYTTQAFDTRPLGRTDMVTVVNSCIADMNAVKEDLPWTYTDPTLVGVRAMRGGAIALLMHLNMWAVGFDEESKKDGYYRAVTTLGTELFDSNEYALLSYSIEDNKRIFKGRTKESLFEIYQSFNNGETFSQYGSLNYLFSHFPYWGNDKYTTSRGWYLKAWMDKIYNDGVPDLRKDLWFENRAAGNNTFQFKKFANVYMRGTDVRNDDDLIIFRLSDAYLLAAEAHAELGEDPEAKLLANKVRERAGATPFTGTGEELKNDIYRERVRELMGEGHYFYDLVRTKRICDPDYCVAPLAVTAFNAGAWAWPIDPSALVDNPNITLNYWR